MRQVNDCKQKSRSKHLWHGWLLGLLGTLLLTQPVHASHKVCNDWFKKKKFAQAAQCFLNALKGQATPSTPTQRLQKGLLVRNASLSMRRAAKADSSVSKASYMREQALKLMQQYIREKLYADKIQRRNAQSIIESLQDVIGYTRLIVLTSDENARIDISGFHYKQRARGKFVQQIRPGAYTVAVTYPNGKVKAKTLEIKPNQPQVLKLMATTPKTRRPPTPRKRTTPRPTKPTSRIPAWTTLIAGVVCLGVGGALVGAAMSSHNQRTILEREYQKKVSQGQSINPDETARLRNAWGASNQWLGASIVVGGIGLAAVAVGVVLFATSNKAPPPPTAKDKASSSTVSIYHEGALP